MWLVRSLLGLPRRVDPLDSLELPFKRRPRHQLARGEVRRAVQQLLGILGRSL